MKDKLSGTLETGDPDEHCSENRKVNNYDWPSSRMVVEARGSGTRLVVVRVAFFPKVLWGGLDESERNLEFWISGRAQERMGQDRQGVFR